MTCGGVGSKSNLLSYSPQTNSCRLCSRTYKLKSENPIRSTGFFWNFIGVSWVNLPNLLGGYYLEMLCQVIKKLHYWWWQVRLIWCPLFVWGICHFILERIKAVLPNFPNWFKLPNSVQWNEISKNPIGLVEITFIIRPISVIYKFVFFYSTKDVPIFCFNTYNFLFYFNL